MTPSPIRGLRALRVAASGIVAAAIATACVTGLGNAQQQIAADPPVTLNPLLLTKYVDPLPVPGPMAPARRNHYEIGMWAVSQRFSSQLPPTTVWGYGPTQATASYPAATIEAVRGVPITVSWTNNLPPTHLLDYAIDPTLHMAMPMEGIPVVPHLHGGESEPPSDGHPDAWFTQGFREKGPGWKQKTFTYYNAQPPATLWYHDHALGLTRLNVYAGLAGFYLLRDPGHEPAGLPSGSYEIPIVIQDRMLYPNGSLFYPYVGDNPEHPVWVPEFFGDIIVVNGKAWPYLDVEPRKYRFRFLNGSNARFYSLRLFNAMGGAAGPAFYQIGTDGGYLAAPVVLNDPMSPMSPRLTIAPGERADVVIDFSGLPVGTRLTLKNSARAPFPGGTAADPRTVGQIMEFRVVPLNGTDTSVIPATLNTIPTLTGATLTRTLTLNELSGENGPLAALLNGQTWDAPVNQLPVVGSTEIWQIVNLSEDAHPIHLHGVQFQLLNRQRVKTRMYEEAWSEANPEVPAEEVTTIPVEPYLQGMPAPADPNERGWKDTFRMNPGEVTRVIVRFTPIDGSYPYDPTVEPGYVWHCHILEHEDNEMMRPFKMVAPTMASIRAPEPIEPIVVPTDVGMEVRPVANTLHFTLPDRARVDVELFSVLGQRVRNLARGEFESGRHELVWDGADDGGNHVPNGVYFYRVLSGHRSWTGRMVMVR